MQLVQWLQHCLRWWQFFFLSSSLNSELDFNSLKNAVSCFMSMSHMLVYERRQSSNDVFSWSILSLLFPPVFIHRFKWVSEKFLHFSLCLKLHNSKIALLTSKKRMTPFFILKKKTRFCQHSNKSNHGSTHTHTYIYIRKKWNFLVLDFPMCIVGIVSIWYLWIDVFYTNPIFCRDFPLFSIQNKNAQGYVCTGQPFELPLCKRLNQFPVIYWISVESVRVRCATQ